MAIFLPNRHPHGHRIVHEFFRVGKDQKIDRHTDTELNDGKGDDAIPAVQEYHDKDNPDERENHGHFIEHIVALHPHEDADIGIEAEKLGQVNAGNDHHKACRRHGLRLRC